jgi:hypothetical protein
MKSQEIKDHEVSVKIGNAFREAYNKSNDNEQIMNLLEQYKEARRKLSQHQGKRHGAYDAYLSTQ